jgi:hypothetical protein
VYCARSASARPPTPSSHPQVPSTSPYAHWSWYQYGHNASSDPLLNCVSAWGDLAYEDFYGDASSATQLSSVIHYQISSGAALKHGWTPATCNSVLPYICQLPTALFPCYPPPSPPTPPPQPPSPPSPPAPPSCEWLLGTAVPPRVCASHCMTLRITASHVLLPE